MKLIKTISLCLTISAICLGAHAQNKGRVTGVVKDAITRSQIGNATVVLIDKSTNSTTRETQAGADGGFIINSLPHGIFTLQISFAGYETLVTEDINITTASDTVELGVVNMYPYNAGMPGAVIKQQKSILFALQFFQFTCRGAISACLSCALLHQLKHLFISKPVIKKIVQAPLS